LNRKLLTSRAVDGAIDIFDLTSRREVFHRPDHFCAMSSVSRVDQIRHRGMAFNCKSCSSAHATYDTRSRYLGDIVFQIAPQLKNKITFWTAGEWRGSAFDNRVLQNSRTSGCSPSNHKELLDAQENRFFS
jgi:hypothetical protein